MQIFGQISCRFFATTAFQFMSLSAGVQFILHEVLQQITLEKFISFIYIYANRSKRLRLVEYCDEWQNIVDPHFELGKMRVPISLLSDKKFTQSLAVFISFNFFYKYILERTFHLFTMNDIDVFNILPTKSKYFTFVNRKYVVEPHGIHSMVVLVLIVGAVVALPYDLSLNE